MYRAANTGVVKINRLPVSFFERLFEVKSVQGLQKLISDNTKLFQRMIADKSIPKMTRYFIRDFVERSRRGRLNETMALKAIPLLYSMATRAGGNSLIQWTVFSKSSEPGLTLSAKERRGIKYADHALHPNYVVLGNDLFELLESGGSRVLLGMSRKLLQGGLIPWARVDYRTVRPVGKKQAFAIVDVGMGTVGTFEKDVIAGKHGLRSEISKRLVDSLLQYHTDRTHARPQTVVIALSEDYFSKSGAIARSVHDLQGLRERFRRTVGHGGVFLVPYSRIGMNDANVWFYSGGQRRTLGKNDMILVYNPNKPMEKALERRIQKHLKLIGSREFAVISDKRKNGPLILAAKKETKSGIIVVPKRGPLIRVASLEDLPRKLESAARKIGSRGIVVKLPLPIERAGKALPSALFFNAQSPLQIKAVKRELAKHFKAGARSFSTEQLVKPSSIKGTEGGLELRFYFSRKKPGMKRYFRRRR